MSAPAVLVPVGAPADARLLLPVAVTLARLLRRGLRLVHVAEGELTPGSLLARLGLLPEETRGLVVDATRGDPIERILAAAREPETAVLVMGACAGPAPAVGERGCPLGPVAEKVLERAPGPVVLVRPGHPSAGFELRSVLLPHDSTPATSAAMRPAADLVRASGAALVVLHVAAPVGPPGEPGSLPVPRYLDQEHHEWPGWASEFLQRLTSAAPIDGPPGAGPAAAEEDRRAALDLGQLRFVVGHGQPGTEVLRVARERRVDLIVLAWHGSLERERARVVKAVLAEAPCPVMVVRCC